MDNKRLQLGGRGFLLLGRHCFTSGRSKSKSNVVGRQLWQGLHQGRRLLSSRKPLPLASKAPSLSPTGMFWKNYRMMRSRSMSSSSSSGNRIIASSGEKVGHGSKLAAMLTVAALGYSWFMLNERQNESACQGVADLVGHIGHHHDIHFGPNFIADAAEKAIPALVNISAIHQGPWGQQVQSAGSGFVIDGSTGLVATNAHVVRNAKILKVTLSDGRVYKGTVYASDSLSDLALVKIDDMLEAPLPEMKIGDSSELRPGEFVIALGSPLNMQNSVTMGIVSSIARGGSELGLESRTEFIQTDAAINVGNSGGPLINLKGEVIGVNTLKVAMSDGVGFAIPINTAWLVLTQLKNDKRVVRPFLGLRMTQLNKNLVRYERKLNSKFPDVDEGLLIVNVAPDSPASRAGMKPGDVIVEFEGRKVKNVSDVTKVIGYDVGKTYNLKVRSINGSKDLSVTTEGLQH